MKKALLTFIVIISTMNCSPVFGQEIALEDTSECKTNYDYSVFIDFDLDSECAELIKNGESKEMVCIGDNVNVREQPNTNCNVLGKLYTDVTVEAIAVYNNWVCITTQDGIAFVHKDYLKEHTTDMKTDNKWGITITESELDTLCRIVMLESGGESDLGQQAVTEVILNRVVHPYYPNDVLNVLSHVDCGYVQFSTWKNRNSKKATPSQQVKENVLLVLSGQTNILPYETVYFSRKPVNKRIQAHIGDHYFCNY